MKNRWYKISTGFITLLLLSGSAVFAQSDWKVDEAKAKMKNPVAASETNIKEGQSLFLANCKSCHGDPGKANGLPLVPKPTDMANAAFLSTNTDGAIFTKVTEGRVAMPSFKAVLSETQRWQIVNYIRSLDKNKTAAPVQIADVTKASMNVGAPFKIELSYNKEENMLVALVEGTNADGAFAPASGVEVGFFVKRYFGKLPFGEKGAVSDENGMLKASVPIDLPGGEDGKALAIVKLMDADAYGDVSAQTEINVKAVEIVNLLDERSLWTVRVMAPWWLIITY